MSIDRLYGLPGADSLQLEPEDVYELGIQDCYEQEEVIGKTFQIEEWDTYPPEEHLPSYDRLLEWIDEWTVENGEVAEDYEVPIYDPIVIAAARSLIHTIAEKTHYRMARSHLRTLILSFDEKGEPLLDGKPMYVKNSDPDPDPGYPLELTDICFIPACGCDGIVHP